MPSEKRRFLQRSDQLVCRATPVPRAYSMQSLRPGLQQEEEEGEEEGEEEREEGQEAANAI